MVVEGVLLANPRHRRRHSGRRHSRRSRSVLHNPRHRRHRRLHNPRARRGKRSSGGGSSDPVKATMNTVMKVDFLAGAALGFAAPTFVQRFSPIGGTPGVLLADGVTILGAYTVGKFAKMDTRSGIVGGLITGATVKLAVDDLGVVMNLVSGKGLGDLGGPGIPVTYSMPLSGAGSITSLQVGDADAGMAMSY